MKFGGRKKIEIIFRMLILIPYVVGHSEL